MTANSVARDKAKAVASKEAVRVAPHTAVNAKVNAARGESLKSAV